MFGRLLATAAWFAVLVPTAQAVTTVEVRSTKQFDDRGHDFSSAGLLVRGGDEAGDLRVTATDDGAVSVSDSAGVRPGTGCAAQVDGSVRCVFPYLFTGAVVDAGGGDDRVALDVVPISIVRGGPGADLLEAFVPFGQTGHALYGGPGDDVIRGSGTLVGGAGRDHLLGGPGGDRLNGDGDGVALEPDLIDGGGGVNRVDYTGTSSPVMVDLADPGPDGGDTVINVEHAVGGAGDDRIAGTDGDNWLEGGGGDDVILGRAGADRLLGEEGDDALDGGAGDDRLEGRGGIDRLIGGDGDDALLPDRGRGVVECGAGADSVDGPGPRMAVPGDCERVGVDFFDLTRVRLGRTLRFSLQYARQIAPPCRTNLTVMRGTRTVATTSIRTPDYRVHRVVVRVRGRPGGPLALRFRSAEACDRRSGGTPRGGFVLPHG